MFEGAALRSALQLTLCSCLGMYNYCDPAMNEFLPFASFQIITYIFLAAGDRQIHATVTVCSYEHVVVYLRLSCSCNCDYYPCRNSTRAQPARVGHLQALSQGLNANLTLRVRILSFPSCAVRSVLRTQCHLIVSLLSHSVPDTNTSPRPTTTCS
jgi:hypothetical protein